MSVIPPLLVAAAVCSWPRPRRIATRLPRVEPASSPTTGVRSPVAGLAVLGVAAALLSGAPWWWSAGLAVAGAVGSRARPREQLPADELPLVCELMAACLAAGAGLHDALSAAVAAGGPAIRGAARPVQAALTAGAAPNEAWATWLADEGLAPVARTCIRSAGSGAAAGRELARVATRLRAARQAEVQRRVGAVSIWVVMPVGLCFLPAFVAVGVVPVVVGLVGTLR